MTYCRCIVPVQVEDYVRLRHEEGVCVEMTSVGVHPCVSPRIPRICDLCVSLVSPRYDTLVRVQRRYFHVKCIEPLVMGYTVTRALLVCCMDVSLPRELITVIVVRLWEALQGKKLC